MDNPEQNDTEENSPDARGMKSSTNTSWLMPVALLLVLLVIPFSLNTLMHMLASKNQYVHPVIMKIPIDRSAVTAPVEAKQFESFEVALNVNTQKLAELINEIVAISSEGASIQGITGFVSPNMKAEIAGKGFHIDNPGPREQLYILNDATEWKWQVVPESSGIQTIQFKMHITSSENDQQKVYVVELAEANISVDSNPLMWVVHNWWLIVLLALIVFGGWKALRLYNER